MRRVCVFCGSSAGRDRRYRDAADELGGLLVERGLGLVFGGGQVGLMGVVADSVLRRGGEAIGVIPRGLARKELMHTGLTALHVVDSMHARKALMAELADAFVALPGGLGTLEELFEVVTWAQLGIHAKPIGLLNTRGYFDALLAFVERAIAAGFVRPEYRGFLVVADHPDALLDALEGHRPPPVAGWATPADT
jgi:hypothetical protein